MANRVLPGNGILSGLSLADSRPEDDDTQFESPWARAVREAWERQSGGNANSSNDSAPYSSPSLQTFGAVPWDSAPGPTNTFASGMPMGPPLWSQLPLHRPQGQTTWLAQNSSPSEIPPGPSRPQENVADGGSAMVQPPGWPRMPVEDQWATSPPVVPASYADSADGPKWWGPPILWDPWQEWRENFKKGMQGLINSRSRPSSSAGGGDDKEACHDRYEDEQNRCYQRKWLMTHAPSQVDACRERATQRWVKCLQNGYPDGPGEVDEWGDKDEEVWRNLHR